MTDIVFRCRGCGREFTADPSRVQHPPCPGCGERSAPKPGLTGAHIPVKDTNPKDAIGSKKPGLAHVPSTALFELAAAHTDGAVKYGAFNWRDAGVRASIYREAIDRHLAAWWEGEDRAGDSGVHHLGHVMACCAILIDAIACDKLNDDRPTPAPENWMGAYRELREALVSEEDGPPRERLHIVGP